MKALLAIILSAQTAIAATYYVATTGDNSNDGSSGSPWRNIHYAVTNVTAGDVIVVNDGVYETNICRLQLSGTAENRITLRAANKWLATNRGSLYISGSYWTISNLAWDTNTIPAFPGESGFIHGVATADYIVVDGCKFTGGRYASGGDMLAGVMMDYTLAFSAGPQSWIVTNCLYQSNYYKTFSLQGANHVIVSNRVEDNVGWDFAYICGSNHMFLGNYCSNWFEGPGHPDLFQANSGDANSWAINMLVDGNRFDYCQQISSLEQDQNSASNWNFGYRDWVFRNNIFSHCTNKGDVTMPGFRFYNNLFYMSGQNSSSVILFNVGSKGIATNCTMTNNIFIKCGSNPANTGFGWYGWEDTNVLHGSFFDHNMVSGDAWAAKASGGTDQWHFASRGYEPNGINGGDPAFSSEAALNFRLLSTSPLVDAGATIGSFSNDFFNGTRPFGSAWDVGPTEFSIITNGLVLRYSFDGNVTTNCPDDSGIGNIGWKMSETNWIAGTNVSGRSCAFFNVVTNGEWEPNQGNGTYIAATNLNSLKNLTNGTLCLWVWHYSNDIVNARQDCALVDGGYGNEATGKTNTYTLRRRWSDSFNGYVTTFHRYDASANPYRLIEFPDEMDATVGGDSGGWHHIAVTWSATNGTTGNVTGYYDGTNYSSTNMVVPFFTVTNNYQWLALGCWGHDGTPQMEDDTYPNNGWFEGLMDDVRIYARALPAAEVASIFDGTEQTSGESDPPPATNTLQKVTLRGARVTTRGGVTFR